MTGAINMVPGLFDTLEEQANFNTVLLLVLAFLALIKAIVLAVIGYRVALSHNDLRTVVKVASSTEGVVWQTLSDKVDRTDERVQELHRVLIHAAGKTEESLTAAQSAAVHAASKAADVVRTEAQGIKDTIKEVAGDGHSFPGI